MSRTDKTDPWYVWLYEHPSRARETHRCGVQQVYALAKPGEEANQWGYRQTWHDYGPCDLPEFTPEGIHNVAGAKCQWLPKDRWGTTQAHGRVCNCKWCFPAAHKSRGRDKRQWRKDWEVD